MVEERYRRQILTDKSIGQRPAIIDADDWPGDDAAQGMIFTRKLERRLYHAKELHLHEALSKAKLSRMGISAPVRAVAAAMIGLERMETRMRKSRNDVDLV
jgi:hypothetical protein